MILNTIHEPFFGEFTLAPVSHALYCTSALACKAKRIRYQTRLIVNLKGHDVGEVYSLRRSRRAHYGTVRHHTVCLYILIYYNRYFSILFLILETIPPY